MKDPAARLNISIKNPQKLRATEMTKINRWYPGLDLTGYTLVDLASPLNLWLSKQNIADGVEGSCSGCDLGQMFKSYGFHALVVPSVTMSYLIDEVNKRVIRAIMPTPTVDLASKKDTKKKNSPQWVAHSPVYPSRQLGGQPPLRPAGNGETKRRGKRTPKGLRNIHGNPTGGVFKPLKPNVRYTKVK